MTPPWQSNQRRHECLVCINSLITTSFHPDAEGDFARVKAGRQTRSTGFAERHRPAGLIDALVDVVEMSTEARRRWRVNEFADRDAVLGRDAVPHALRYAALLVVRLSVRNAYSTVSWRLLSAETPNHFRYFRLRVYQLTTLSFRLKYDNNIKQVYRSRYDKPPLAARCCYVANDFKNFTGDKRTNRQAEEHCHRVKPPHLRAGLK